MQIMIDKVKTSGEHTLYGIYEISSRATEHEGAWHPHCCISWRAPSPQLIKLCGLPSFTTEAEAQEYALKAGREWVRRRNRSKRQRRVLIR